MNRSEQQAVELMNTMFGPLVKSINGRYELKVQFKANPGSGDNVPLEDNTLDG
jgi:hypothetical protein